MSDKFLHILSRKTAMTIGMVRYFTAKKCSKGHISERYAKGGSCIDCMNTPDMIESRKLRSSDWYYKNIDHARMIQRAYRMIPEKKVLISECNKRYRIENASLISKKRKIYREKNKEKIRMAIRKWELENKDRVIAARVVWIERNIEKKRAYSREWDSRNKESKTARVRKRRAIKRGAEGTHTAADVIRIFEAQRGLCATCETKLFKSGEKKFHVDHVFPLSRGGSNDKYNLQCLCPSCNLRKQAKDPIDWAQENGKLI